MTAKKPLVYLPNGDIGPIPQGEKLAYTSFSRKTIREEEFFIVPDEEQMLVHGSLKVDGILKLDGELCLL